jgi:hypothetical protein
VGFLTSKIMLYIKKLFNIFRSGGTRSASEKTLPRRSDILDPTKIIDYVKSMQSPLSITKVDDGVDYFLDFLDLIDIPLVHMEDVNSVDGPRWCIRHDVDHSLDVALTVARAECERGYKSTYFLLTPGSYPYGRNYYGDIVDGKIVHDKELIDKCKYLEDLGHRIGLHNDLISLAFKLRRAPGEILEQELEYFQRNGIRLWGTAAHGNPLARQLQYNNKEIFVGCPRQGKIVERVIRHDGWEVMTHSLRLEDFGFLYEAYSLPRDSRISESGRRWGGKVAGQRIDRERLAEQFDIELFRSYVKRLTAAAGVQSLQVMTHPEHWVGVDAADAVMSKE